MEVVDHLGEAESYKNSWGGEKAMFYNVVMESRTLRGKIGVAAYNGIRKLKGVVAENVK